MVAESYSSESKIDVHKIVSSSFWDDIKMPLEESSNITNDHYRLNESTFVENMLEDIVTRALDRAESVNVIKRVKMFSESEKDMRTHNRTTSIVVQDWDTESIAECRNNFVKVNVLHCSSSEKRKKDENDNNTLNNKEYLDIDSDKKTKAGKPKRKKKISFSSIFHINKNKSKEHKTDEEAETYDNFPNQLPNIKGTLSKSRKYASAFELSSKTAIPKIEKQSIFQKLAHIGDESSNFLRRSLSFRDVRKKEKTPTRELQELRENKNQLWRQSLQSLVENDNSVSYNDLSFINYDALNEFNYTEPVQLRAGCGDNNSYIGRSQSMREKSTPHSRPAVYSRHISIAPSDYRSSSDLKHTTSAVSLPSLRNVTKESSEPKDESSSCAEIGRTRQISRTTPNDSQNNVVHWHSNSNSSLSGSGNVKLRRHNATRQKSRLPGSYVEARPRNEDQTVRSRSLNHLDSLEMRQSGVPSSETTLKDSKSEPDCTRQLPIVLPSGDSQESTTPVTCIDSHTAARKYMLSRSQKSSSECFSVNFQVGDETTWDNELFFPAQRGITLHDSLAKLCELRNIDLSTCDVRLQDKDNHTESFLQFTQDTAVLVGKHVRITAKDSSNKKYGSFHSNHSRKQSGSYRPKSSSFFSSSTEDQNTVSSTHSLQELDQSKRQIKQRITAFFGNSKDTKYEVLIEQLDRYSRQGIPPSSDYPQGQCESIDALYKLEDDWKDIIKEYNDLNDKQQQQQTALWELIKTEVAYIKTLKVVTELFLGCLRDLQSKNLFKEIDTEKLFSNIREILDANVIFWRNTLFPLVRDMRKYRRPTCLENMLEGFSKLHDTFQPYFKYCAEQARCQHYCRENLESEVFTAFLTWCESQKECNRLRLMDILVQPMQRLTKYGLLLKAILKNTDEDVEKESLQTMIKMVDDFVINVNSSLKHRQDKERLKGIIARIESYDIVESKDDDIERILKREKSFTQLDLTRPMLGCHPERKRHLLLEGDLKLKDSASKIEVHCFLLTDMLLVCKPSTKKGGATMKVIKQPYLVDRLVVQDLTRETPSLAVVYRNEFDMAVVAFILQNNDAKKIRGWKEGLAKAQSLYAQAKQMSYMADESLDADYNLDFNLESEYHSLHIAPRSPMATSSRASRVSSLAHSHSGSVEMNDQSSVGSTKDQSRGISIENENRTGSISSDEGFQPLPSDKSPGSQKSSFKNRMFHKTPNTLSVQPVGSLGQSLPNLTLGSPNVASGLGLTLHHNTLSVPSNKAGSSQLLSPTHRGISYPPPSPTRGNLRRSLAISQNKNPPLVKTRQVNSASSVSSSQVPASLDFDVPVIAGVSNSDENCESFSRGQHRQAIKRSHRYHTAGMIDDIKKNNNRDVNIHKRLSWNCTAQDQKEPTEDQT